MNFNLFFNSPRPSKLSFNTRLARLLNVIFIVLSMFFAFSPTLVTAQTVQFFTRPDCSHCQDLETFINQVNLQESATIVRYDLTEPDILPVWNTFTQHYTLPKATPIIIINDTLIQGFDTAQTTGQSIINLLNNRNDPNLSLEEMVSQDFELNQVSAIAQTCADTAEECSIEPEDSQKLTLPIIGTLDLAQYSLPVLSFVLGFIDGFNPCAMWVLVTFIVLLSQVGDKRKLILMVGSFVVAEAIMYYLILTTWFTAWDFVGLDAIVTPIVGSVAIGAGIFFLYQWWNERGEVACKVTTDDQKQATRNRMKNIIAQPLNIATFIGIVGLALSVNIIEFACSIGIPQTFTKILELNNLTWLSSQGLIWIYILAYMIDDFIVFGLALWSFEKLGLTNKYARWSHLIGGLLMLLLGLVLVFNPNMLVLL